MDFFPTPTATRAILAADVGGLRGALTALGTLAFVAVCFAAVVLVDRRSAAADGPAEADSVVGPSGPGGAIGVDPGRDAAADTATDAGVADDVWPLRRTPSSGQV